MSRRLSRFTLSSSLLVEIGMRGVYLEETSRDFKNFTFVDAEAYEREVVECITTKLQICRGEVLPENKESTWIGEWLMPNYEIFRFQDPKFSKDETSKLMWNYRVFQNEICLVYYNKQGVADSCSPIDNPIEELVQWALSLPPLIEGAGFYLKKPTSLENS